jgi:hypothetical protein
MKKGCFVIMLLAVVAIAQAQDGNLKKQTYFRLGLSVPSWKYMGIDSKSDWPDDWGRIGGVFEVGSIYMLNSIKLAPGMRIGINVDFLSLNYHRFNDKEVSGNSENFLFLGSKIGPSFSYCPVQRLIFDTYVKFNPVWVAGEISVNSVDIDGEQAYLGFLGIRYSVGLNVRYSLLMVGFEFNPGFVRMKWYDQEENKLSDIYRGNVDNNSKRTPVPGMNFTVGLSF